MKNSLAALATAAFVSLAAVPASAAIFTAPMIGDNEVPPTGSAATGFATVKLAGDELDVTIVYSDLTGGPPSAAHIHCCTAPGTNTGVAVGFPAFPTTLSGSYSHAFDLLDPTIYTSAFLTANGGTAAGAAAALEAGLYAGMAYSNIHNGQFPGGEIRGLLALAAAPEPATWALFGAGLTGLVFLRRRRARA